MIVLSIGVVITRLSAYRRSASLFNSQLAFLRSLRNSSVAIVELGLSLTLLLFETAS